MNNGLGQQEPMESLQFEDILEYYQKEVAELNKKLAIAEARVKGRDRVIKDYQSLLDQSSSSVPPLVEPRTD